MTENGLPENIKDPREKGDKKGLLWIVSTRGSSQ